MNWNQALNLIVANITINLDLDPNVQFKIVKEVPPFQCNNNGFNGSAGFRVQVGATSNIEITLEMLEIVFNKSVNDNNGIYKNEVFRGKYKTLCKSKPCYVQSIGKIFSMSGVAKQQGRSYIIL